MRNLIYLFTASLLFISCDTEVVWSDTQAISGTWDKNESITFSTPELDSLQAYNVYINIRNSNEYPFNNLFLVAEVAFPHGKTVVDTLEYKMAYPNGEWMGEGFGNIKENKLWFKENIRFREPGNYNITITQAVRNNGEVDGVSQLPGITDVGVSIEAATQQF